MEAFPLPEGSWQVLIVLVSSLFVIRILWSIIYNLYFHPLRHFPGPRTAAATTIPFTIRVLNGWMNPWLRSIHDRYGDVVRIRPDELSFTKSEVWRDVYAARPEFTRSLIGVLPPPNGVHPLPTASTADHRRQRRILSHAFSDSALKEQEFLLQACTDLLIARLRDQIVDGQAEVDICKWYSFTSFDIMGELCFGESFSCLENGTHQWIETMFKGLKALKIMSVFDDFPPLHLFRSWLIPPWIKAKALKNIEWARQSIDKRLQQKTERPDFLKYILENNQEKHESMSRAEIDSTVTVLVAAGSESTATAISTVTYFALKNPAVLHRLRSEIHDDLPLTVANLSRLPFLQAVIQEALRMHPSAPVAAPRLIDRPGVTVCGIPVPQGCRVSIAHKVASRRPSNFVEPDSYLPERWLNSSSNREGRFAADDRAVSEPFLVGARNCIGRTLAWAELRLILAKMVRNFDLALAGSEEKDGMDWTDQKAYLSHERKPLFVKIQPRKLGE